jgi:hypothetical protein
VCRTNQFRLQPALEEHPVVRHGGDDHPGGPGGGHQRDQVDDALEAVRAVKAGGEHHRQQEREKDLDAGLGDPQLLQ